MNQKGNTVNPDSKTQISPYLQRLLELIKTIKYGSVTIVIQNGQVVQIDKNEKMRLK